MYAGPIELWLAPILTGLAVMGLIGSLALVLEPPSTLSNVATSPDSRFRV